jgi:hypothetical protein
MAVIYVFTLLKIIPTYFSFRQKYHLRLPRAPNAGARLQGRIMLRWVLQYTGQGYVEKQTE